MGLFSSSKGSAWGRDIERGSARERQMLARETARDKKDAKAAKAYLKASRAGRTGRR